MTPIRPDQTSLPPAAPTGQTVQMRAAQAAFFRAAMGDVHAVPPQRPVATAPSSEPEAPRLPRPGQLLDIRV